MFWYPLLAFAALWTVIALLERLLSLPVERAASDLEAAPLSRTTVEIQHTNGHGCPSFIVTIGDDYPVLWCPFCGDVIRDAEILKMRKGLEP